MDALWVILFRWIHVATACVAVGSLFFMRFILPLGILQLEPEARQAVFLKCRRIFKMVIHSSILLLLVSGTFNAIRNWPAYKQAPQVAHPIFGIHVLFALVAFTIALVLLAGKEPPKSHKAWAAGNLVLLLLTIAAASTLKYVREKHVGVSDQTQVMEPIRNVLSGRNGQ